MKITAKELWGIFDQECRNRGIVALTFGDTDISGNPRQYPGPPMDLTVWKNISTKLNEICRLEDDRPALNLDDPDIEGHNFGRQ